MISIIIFRTLLILYVTTSVIFKLIIFTNQYYDEINQVITIGVFYFLWF